MGWRFGKFAQIASGLTRLYAGRVPWPTSPQPRHCDAVAADGYRKLALA